MSFLTRKHRRFREPFDANGKGSTVMQAKKATLSIRAAFLAAVCFGLPGCGGGENDTVKPLNVVQATGKIPADRCPFVRDRICPENCVPIIGVRLDGGRRCFGNEVILDCQKKDAGIPFSQLATCYLEVRTGESYFTNAKYFSPDDRFAPCPTQFEGALGWDSCPK
jgi:hypothetical protein